MTDSKKILHFHVADSMGNRYTLICRLTNGSIRYTFYGGHGSSGMGFALSNHFRGNSELPMENNEGETLDQFKQRVRSVVRKTTLSVVKEVSTKVTFK